VKVLLTLPIRWCMSADIGSSEPMSATPRVSTHVYSGVWTAATTPGASLSEKDCSNAAFRASSGACPVSPVVVVSPPPQLLTSRAANAATTSPISRLLRIPYVKNILLLPVEDRRE
jgi:hypothetical protein